jgi:glutamate/tyrosine decarboxylase-like PLP-dependent enzyme
VIEASPLTTVIEIDVGKQLCGMIGIDQEKGWGHITCDGSIANLESIWAGKSSIAAHFGLVDNLIRSSQPQVLSLVFDFGYGG